MCLMLGAADQEYCPCYLSCPLHPPLGVLAVLGIYLTFHAWDLSLSASSAPCHIQFCGSARSLGYTQPNSLGPAHFTHTAQLTRASSLHSHSPTHSGQLTSLTQPNSLGPAHFTHTAPLTRASSLHSHSPTHSAQLTPLIQPTVQPTIQH